MCSAALAQLAPCLCSFSFMCSTSILVHVTPSFAARFPFCRSPPPDFPWTLDPPLACPAPGQIPVPCPPSWGPHPALLRKGTDICCRLQFPFPSSPGAGSIGSSCDTSAQHMLSAQLCSMILRDLEMLFISMCQLHSGHSELAGCWGLPMHVLLHKLHLQPSHCQLGYHHSVFQKFTLQHARRLDWNRQPGSDAPASQTDHDTNLCRNTGMDIN